MQLGMIGLGRMGANMTTRLVRGGDGGTKHDVVVYDRSADAIAASVKDGATGASDLKDMVAKLAAPPAPAPAGA